VRRRPIHPSRRIKYRVLPYMRIGSLQRKIGSFGESGKNGRIGDHGQVGSAVTTVVFAQRGSCTHQRIIASATRLTPALRAKSQL
jgi:hypothetical protein